MGGIVVFEELKKPVKPFGLPWYVAALFIAIVWISAATGALSTDLAGTMAFMLSIAIVTYEIGERIPFWNSYVGGGLVFTYLVSAYLFTYKLVPEKYAKACAAFMGKQDFLTLFIVFLITGSILALDRKLLVRSFLGYIPAIFGGLIGAAILGVGAGFLCGIDPVSIVLKYVLPIMGGGNGAGAVPLSQIYETVTGDSAANYYAFAITILTIANIFAIITAALLNKLGNAKPVLTGDHSTLMRKGSDFAKDDEKVEVKIKDLGGAFFLAVAFFTLGRLFAKTLLPTIFGVAIHQFAYMIIFVAIVAALGIVPNNIRAASKKLQSFFSSNMVIIIMVGVGIDTDINELIAAITLSNVIIALAIVVGAIFGSAIVGWLVGFYPIDSAVTAGLCMANRGGSGDLAVLGAADRMGLIAYAQLSSRLGGGIVLIIGSFLFGTFLKAA